MDTEQNNTVGISHKQKELNTSVESSKNEHCDNTDDTVAMEQTQDETLDYGNNVCQDEHGSSVNNRSKNYENNSRVNENEDNILCDNNNQKKNNQENDENYKKQNRTYSFANKSTNRKNDGTSNVILNKVSSQDDRHDSDCTPGCNSSTSCEKCGNECQGSHHNHHDLAYQISIISQFGTNNDATTGYNATYEHSNINSRNDNCELDRNLNEESVCTSEDGDIIAPDVDDDYHNDVHGSNDDNDEDKNDNDNSIDNYSTSYHVGSTRVDSNHGDSDHGDSDHGDSSHGDSDHGDSNHGESNQGDSDHGDKNNSSDYDNNHDNDDADNNDDDDGNDDGSHDYDYQDTDKDKVGDNKARTEQYSKQIEETCPQIITNDRGVMIMLFEDDD